MPQIKTEQDLKKIMEQATKKAIQGASNEILELFQEEYLKKIAYISNPKMYQRTNEFFESWNFTDVKKLLNIISTELWYNPSKLVTFDSDNFIHGSKYSSPPDVRDNLEKILNKSGYSSSLWLSVKRSAPYWDTFIYDMFSGGQLDKIVSKHFVANGFTRV